MANKRFAIKRHKQSLKRRARNRAAKSMVKTTTKKAKVLIESKDKEKAMDEVRIACSKIDKAAEKGIIHKNNAARKKSRLMHAFSRTFAEQKA